MDRILEQDTAEDVACPATEENHEGDIPTIEETFESVEALFEHIVLELAIHTMWSSFLGYIIPC